MADAEALTVGEVRWQVLPRARALFAGGDGLPLARQRLAAALGRFTAWMHNAGVLHHDLHAGNLLVRWADDEPELFLIDLHYVRLHEHVGWRRGRDNLVMLNRWFQLRVSRA